MASRSTHRCSRGSWIATLALQQRPGDVAQNLSWIPLAWKENSGVWTGHVWDRLADWGGRPGAGTTWVFANTWVLGARGSTTCATDP